MKSFTDAFGAGTPGAQIGAKSLLDAHPEETPAWLGGYFYGVVRDPGSSPFGYHRRYPSTRVRAAF